MTGGENKIMRRRLANAYLSAVISISLVLLLVGVASMLLVNAKSVSDYFKEHMQISVLLKQEVEDDEALAFQAELDSLERVRRRMADSLAALEEHLLDSLTQTRGTILNPTRLGGLYTTKLEAKYYIIVGAFRTRSYAERKLNKCSEAGYTATIISFRNGLLAVGVCPSDSINDTWNKLRELRGTDICPKDAWILVNE